MKIKDSTGKEWEVDSKYIDTSTDENFVARWIYAYKNKIGLKEMTSMFELDYVKTSQRASALRRAGVKLPTMPKANQERNILETHVENLNQMIANELGVDALFWRQR